MVNVHDLWIYQMPLSNNTIQAKDSHLLLFSDKKKKISKPYYIAWNDIAALTSSMI